MLESADRVLRALEVCTPAERNLSLSEIAERLGLPKSSVYRLLATLAAHGFVERDATTRRYRLGIRLFEIGSAAIHERGLHSATHPVLEELAVTTGETCHVAVLSGAEAVYIYKIDGPSSFSMTSRVGGRAPCHCTSIGKVLIAWGGEELLKRLAWAGLRPYTSRTITNVSQLGVELERVRALGYALDRDEYEENLCCAAAPVRDHAGQVVAAIGIAGPSHRLTTENLDRLVPAVVGAAGAVSRNLGYVNVEQWAVVGS
jgi:IclR family transcriptional regulator, KDG regulon repressor